MSFVLAVFVGSISLPTVAVHAAPPSGTKLVSPQLPLRFEPNQGQTNPAVKFLGRGAGFGLFLSDAEAVLILHDGPASRPAVPASPLDMAQQSESARRPASQHILRMHWLGSNSNPAVSGSDEMAGKSNYFYGHDPSAWRTNIPQYGRVNYKQIYPGVDLTYYGNQNQLEYDLTLAPRADAARVRWQIAGADELTIDPLSGDLRLSAASHAVTFHKPVAYQIERSTGDKRYVEARYALLGAERVGFSLGAYDHNQPLVIDPTLSYSTYLGGSSDDYATSLAVSSSGNVYVTGYTDSTNFPTTSGSYQPQCAGNCATFDAFVTELDSTGSSLVYSTYLGGTNNDYAEGIAIDSSGNAFVVGTTYSIDFPTTRNAFQNSCGSGACVGGTAFITKINSTGAGLTYSTYLGGSNQNQGNGIAIDSKGNAYVTGYTQSTDFPVTSGVFQKKCGSCIQYADAFVTKLNTGGTALSYSSYLGGSNADIGYAIALDSSSNAYVTGYTYSTNFPTTVGAYQTKLSGPTGAFISKVNPTASALTYSTYLGGSGSGNTPCAACAAAITVDSTGNAYVAGLTWEPNFPTTTGSFQPNYGGGYHDAFVTKLNTSGSGLVYSTYVGGVGDDGATSIAVDSSGNAWVKGNTFSSNFPTTPGALYPTEPGGGDAYLLALDSTGAHLLYSTYFGGSGTEYGVATRMLALDSAAPPNVYITGYTNSTDFPVTAGAYQTSSGGSNDAYISKFAPSSEVGLSTTTLNLGNQTVGTKGSPQNLTVTNAGTADLTFSSITITGANASEYTQTNTCTGSISPLATCTVSVSFTPAATGTRTATLNLNDNAPTSPQTVSLTGVGVGNGPAVTLTPSSLTFPTTVVGVTSSSQTVTLTNTGTSSLSITKIVASGDFAQTNTCSATVNAGASCTFTVTFTPTRINTRTGSISITDNAPASPQSVSLTGVGTLVSFSPTSLNFGSVQIGKSSSQSVTLTNTGATSLTVKLIFITGANAGDFSETNNCPLTVAAGGSCSITATFTPTATGSRTASISVSDTGGGSPQYVSLSGTGTN
jgi:hypothetical protein